MNFEDTIIPLLKQEIGVTGHVLNDSCYGQLSIFLDELACWNAKMNLTAITSADDMVQKHIIDSLMLALELPDNSDLLDIGSGAGVPAIPVKIICPTINVTSVDSVARKIYFQNHVIRKLHLKGIKAVNCRVESLCDGHHKFNHITSRAFSSLAHLVTCAAPLLAVDGRIIAMKGAAAKDEISACSADLNGRGFFVSILKDYSLGNNKGKRYLLEIVKREV